MEIFISKIAGLFLAISIYQSFQTCPVPKIINGYLSPHNNSRVPQLSRLVKNGTTLYASCSRGYILLGNILTVCGNDGQWTPRIGFCYTNSNSCESSQFRCSSGICISHIRRCDSKFDCEDRSDEENCVKYNCSIGETMCPDSQCVKLGQICPRPDGNGNTTSTTTTSAVTSTTMRPQCFGFRCSNGKCIRRSWKCDTENDCGDNSDEINCLTAECIGFTCRNSGRCINLKARCDRINHCGDWSDEYNCKRTTRAVATTRTTTIKPISVLEDSFCGITTRMKIYGGSSAALGEHPWLVKLYIKYQGYEELHHCGATLISNLWVLTAAHCVSSIEHSVPVEHIRISVGRYDLSSQESGALEFWTRDIHIHPHFNPAMNYNNDIALLKLPYPLKYTPRIRSACLPSPKICHVTSYSPSGNTVDQCKRVTVAGWGRTEYYPNQDSIVKVAEMDTQPRAVCDRAYYGQLNEAQLCVGNGSPSTCQGDSGGPLLCKIGGRIHVIGVVSYGTDICGEPKMPVVFARVCSAIPWIEYIMEKVQQ